MTECCIVSTLIVNMKYHDERRRLNDSSRRMFEDELIYAINSTKEEEIREFINEYAYLFDDDENTSIKDARNTLIGYVTDLFGTDFTQRRDFTWILPNKTLMIYISGGMSCGDDPTEGYKMLANLAEMSNIKRVGKVLDKIIAGKL